MRGYQDASTRLRRWNELQLKKLLQADHEVGQDTAACGMTISEMIWFGSSLMAKGEAIGRVTSANFKRNKAAKKRAHMKRKHNDKFAMGQTMVNAVDSQDDAFTARRFYDLECSSKTQYIANRRLKVNGSFTLLGTNTSLDRRSSVLRRRNSRPIRLQWPIGGDATTGST